MTLAASWMVSSASGGKPESAPFDMTVAVPQQSAESPAKSTPRWVERTAVLRLSGFMRRRSARARLEFVQHQSTARRREAKAVVKAQEIVCPLSFGRDHH